MPEIRIGDVIYSPDDIIPFLIIVGTVVFMIILPIVTVVNWNREKNGKFSKGKVRNIIIVNKREIDHDFYSEGYRASFYSRFEPTGQPDGVYRQTSVDFRKVGGKILYTKSIDDELFDRVQVGGTYRVRIRDSVIVSVENVLI